MGNNGRPSRRSIDALDAVKECQASIEAARLALAHSEARVKTVYEILARTELVLARIGAARAGRTLGLPPRRG